MFFSTVSVLTLALSILTYQSTPVAAVTTAIAPIAIDRHGWVITADSSQPGNEATNALDGDGGTFWHTVYNPDAPLSHWIMVDMGNVSGAKPSRSYQCLKLSIALIFFESHIGVQAEEWSK